MAIRHWIKDGDIPTKKEKIIGIKPRYVLNLKDIEEYLKSKEN